MSPKDGEVIPFTDQELRLAEEETEEYTLAEIIAHLQAQEHTDEECQ